MQPATLSSLPRFSFESVTVDARGQEVELRRRKAEYYREDLGNGVTLDMVRIPGGTFLMGSPVTEARHLDREGPQHRVTVPEFWMGRYPITQAQWKAVAAFPQVNRELDPDQSRFKGDDRPVEKVTWYEAVEFCDRLSQSTGKIYRLPSEAEWEYACRAGTDTPFHLGETIMTDLANYRGNRTYGNGPTEKNREKTTPVGTFPANAFGLHDMHGNVWEWCMDHWHSNYEGAPSDGSPWLTKDENAGRVLRGGSWFDYPENCQSAVRDYNDPFDSNYYDGLRVVCGFARIG